ncbi:hypothetical protein ASG89_03840 [Paenibacillus sp. Soil766]|nr:hypothetical protein ASG89_03840 [Paenibacillus sp. Soil766]
MADRSVVASKSEPMKAGNRLEDKTQMSMRGVFFLEQFKAVEKKSSRITCFHSKRGKTEAKGTCFVKDCEF